MNTRIVKAFLQYAGGNRTNAERLGKMLGRCDAVYIPFAGGMPEVAFLNTDLIFANDLNEHVMRLAKVIATDHERLEERLRQLTYDQTSLEWARRAAQNDTADDLWRATGYFASQWMIRGGITGTNGQFKGKLSTRYTKTGGCSKVRFATAIRSIETFVESFRRCRFSTVDAFRFLAAVPDEDGAAIFSDEPDWHGASIRYAVNQGQPRFDHIAWWDRLKSFTKTRIVVRYAECEEVHEAFRGWRKIEVSGRRQNNWLLAHVCHELWCCNFDPPAVARSEQGTFWS